MTDEEFHKEANREIKRLNFIDNLFEWIPVIVFLGVIIYHLGFK